MSSRATREAFGATLIELYDQNPDDIFAIDADLAGSTTLAKFGAHAPEHFFDVGIAEQNMIGVAAGIALTGKTVFTGSFAVFGTGRCYDQIRNTVCYAKLNVKVCPTHAGVSVGPDGGSHQMIEDIGLMRGLPHMQVFVPADFHAAQALLKTAAATSGPCYVRLGRAKVPQVYDETQAFVAGGSHVLRRGNDVTIVACGLEVAEALKAAEELSAAGIEATVIDAYSIKPFDEKTLLETVRLSRSRVVVTCEEHSVNNGLGSVVAEVLAERFDGAFKLRRVGMRDAFGTSGNPDELMAHFKLDGASIATVAREALT